MKIFQRGRKRNSMSSKVEGLRMEERIWVLGGGDDQTRVLYEHPPVSSGRAPV